MESKYVTLSPEGKILLPNIKRLVLPDEGYEIADVDLSGADIQVVAADAQCKWLLDYFANPLGCGKVYAYIASLYLQREVDPKGDEYKIFKANYHSSNYGVGFKKIMSMTGLSEKQSKGIIDHYFGLCPEILKWQERQVHDVKTKGYTRNAFGRRMEFWITKNNPTVLNEIYASIPQSTIGDVINRAWVKIRKELYYERENKAIDGVHILMQTHDSLTLQYPYEIAEMCRKRIPELTVVPIPYNPPLLIGADIKVSRVSYGDTIKIK
jgi:DNA polymerase I-like protein with 3'-5' exonuclease and polymerase domains